MDQEVSRSNREGGTTNNPGVAEPIVTNPFDIGPIRATIPGPFENGSSLVSRERIMLLRTLLAFAAIGAICSVSGCTTIRDDDVTASRFGSAPFGLNNAQTTSQGNAFGSITLTSGTNRDGALAVATLATLTPGTPVSSATVSYAGSYAVIGIENITYTPTFIAGGIISGSNFSDTGFLTLDANLAARTLTGTDGTLTVDGTFVGTDLNGSVTYDGQTGALDGQIYEEGGYGGFHGNDADRVFAGGLTFID